MPHKWSGLCCCEFDAHSRDQKLCRRHRRLAHTTPRDTALGNILGHSGWTRTTPTQIAPPLGDTERIDRSGPSVRTRSTLPVQFARFTFKYGHKNCIDTSSQHAPWEALVFSWLGTCMNNKHPTILSLPSGLADCASRVVMWWGGRRLLFAHFQTTEKQGNPTAHAVTTGQCLQPWQQENSLRKCLRKVVRTLINHQKLSSPPPSARPSNNKRARPWIPV